MYAKEFAETTGYPHSAVKQMCKAGIISYLPIGNKYLIDHDKALLEIEQYQSKIKAEKQKIELFTPQIPVIERTDDYSKSLNSLLKKRGA